MTSWMQFVAASFLALFFHSITSAATAGKSSAKDLVVASDGRVHAVVVVGADGLGSGKEEEGQGDAAHHRIKQALHSGERKHSANEGA